MFPPCLLGSLKILTNDKELLQENRAGGGWPVPIIPFFPLTGSSQDMKSPVEKHRVRQIAGEMVECWVHLAASRTRSCHSMCSRPVAYILTKLSGVHASCVCTCGCVRAGRGSSFFLSFFSSFFSPGKSLLPALCTKFSVGVVRILLRTTNSVRP